MSPLSLPLIRKLTVDDVEQFCICRLDALLDAPSALLTSYEEEAPRIHELFVKRMASTVSVLFGAFDGDRLVGLTGIVSEERVKRKHKMLIVSVWVRPEYRGWGIASQMLKAAIDHARTIEGVERLELSVESNNIAAKALYTSFGFTTWGTEPEFLLLDGKRYDEDYMTLKL